MTQMAISNDTRLDLLSKVLLIKKTLTTKRHFLMSKKKDILRIIMTLVAHYDLKVHQMDVKNAFLNENLDEEVFMNQLEDLMVEVKENMVCKLKMSIYELKQAFRQWYLKFNDTIIFFGFKENIVNRYI